MGSTLSNTKPISPFARFALLVFAMLFPTCMASLYFVFLSHGDAKPNAWQQTAYLGGKVLQFALPLLFVWLVDRRLPRPKMPHFAGLGLGLAFGVAVAGGMLALYYGWLRDTWLFDGTGAKVQQKLREVDLLSPAKYIALSVVIVVVHSLAEEYYWRWFTFAQLNRLVSLPLAIALSSFAFMGHHVLVLNAYFPGASGSRCYRFRWPSRSAARSGRGCSRGHKRFIRRGSVTALVDAAIFVIGWDLLQSHWVVTWPVWPRRLLKTEITTCNEIPFRLSVIKVNDVLFDEDVRELLGPSTSSRRLGCESVPTVPS